MICRDDLFAHGGAAGRCDRAGLRVPDDVAVLGWDDTRGALQHPALSSVSPDKEAIARTALELLEDRMAGYDGVGRHRIAPHTHRRAGQRPGADPVG